MSTEVLHFGQQTDVQCSLLMISSGKSTPQLDTGQVHPRVGSGRWPVSNCEFNRQVTTYRQQMQLLKNQTISSSVMTIDTALNTYRHYCMSVYDDKMPYELQTS